MIETKRLSFRSWGEPDAEELFRLASDPDVGPRAGWLPHKSVEESLEIINAATVDIKAMGFPANWENESLWQ